MKIVLNGKEREFEMLGTLSDLLRQLEITPGAPGTAIAVNGRVVPREEVPETPVRDGDRIEVVRAVQGG